MKFVLKAVSILSIAALGSAFAPSSINQAVFSKATALRLAEGETAPDFALTDQNGKVVTRSSIKKPLVVYFYPADGTPGCTVQANAFNEQVQNLRKRYGAELVGISGQDVESKQKFAEELGLDFSILADPKDEVRKAFQVKRAAFGLLPGRVTYVLDEQGVCLKVYDELADAASHVEVAAETLAEYKATKKSTNPLAAFFG